MTSSSDQISILFSKFFSPVFQLLGAEKKSFFGSMEKLFSFSTAETDNIGVKISLIHTMIHMMSSIEI